MNDYQCWQSKKIHRNGISAGKILPLSFINLKNQHFTITCKARTNSTKCFLGEPQCRLGNLEGQTVCTSCVQQATTVNQTEQAVQALACSASAVLPASVDRELLDKVIPRCDSSRAARRKRYSSASSGHLGILRSKRLDRARGQVAYGDSIEHALHIHSCGRYRVTANPAGKDLPSPSPWALPARGRGPFSGHRHGGRTNTG